MNDEVENGSAGLSRNAGSEAPGMGGAPATMPVPRLSMAVRVAAPGSGDVTFIDSLQRMHSHMVGWSPTKQIEANIAGGHKLIAEDAARTPLVYCIARDQYMKRDDVGIVYQLNVLPLKQRNLIGASLIKGVFERAAYACKLVRPGHSGQLPLGINRVCAAGVPHRKRIQAKDSYFLAAEGARERRRSGSSGGTPYWFPSQTTGGAVREDRIVLPIPPGRIGAMPSRWCYRAFWSRRSICPRLCLGVRW